MNVKKEKKEVVMTNGKKVKERLKRSMIMLSGVLFFFLTQAQMAYAANIGQNASDWITEQLFWVGIVVLCIVVVGCLLKHNTVGMFISIIVGGVGLFLIKNPTKMADLGEAIGNTILK